MGSGPETTNKDLVPEALEISEKSPEWDETIRLAKEASAAEHDMKFMEAVRAYPTAVMWSVLVSTAIIMEGYDIVLIGSLFGQSAFQKKYGNYYEGIGYQLSGPWQIGLSNAATVGTIIGSFGNGWFTSRYGYRKVLLTSLVFITGAIFVTFFAPSLPILCLGEILCGIPWGVFATMAPAYASEVCPLALRGYLTVYVNLCWAIGQLIAAGVLQGTQPMSSQWAYRIPFAIQWVWPLPLLVVLFFAPESPWWLVRMNRLADAEASLRKLSKNRTSEQIRSSVALMVHTDQLEKEIESGTSYFDCFKGIERRRTEIVCITFAAQQFSGQQLGGTPTYFFIQAGLPDSIAFKFSVGGLGLACIGTFISWFLLSRFGRRTIYVFGLGLLSLLMFVIGFIQVGTDSLGGSYGMGGVVMFWLLTYYLTIGPICYAIISETSSVRLRSKSICLARIAYYFAQIIGFTVEPYMVNPTEGNLKGKAGFVWGASCFLCFLWAYFRLPETKDRTYEELDILFARRVSARKFSGYTVDAYSSDIQHVIHDKE